MASEATRTPFAITDQACHYHLREDARQPPGEQGPAPKGKAEADPDYEQLNQAGWKVNKKFVQNSNAAKFKLHPAVMANIRYQVVYKKLVRSLRKYNNNKFLANGYVHNTDEP